MSVFLNSFGTENNINHILNNLDFFNSFILYGCPGTGKTNLLNTIFNKLKKNQKCIKVNNSKENILKDIHKELDLTYKKDDYSKLKRKFENERIYIFIDSNNCYHIENIQKLIKLLQESHSDCKIFITSCKKIKFAPLTRSNIVELDIGPLNRKDAYSMIDFLLRSNSRKDISTRQIDQIAEKSGFYAILIKLILGAFFNSNENIDIFFKNKYALYTIKKEYFDTIWNDLSEECKEILKYISLFYNNAYIKTLENILKKNISKIYEELSEKILIEYHNKYSYLSIPPILSEIIRSIIPIEEKEIIRKKILEYCYQNRDVHAFRVECFHQCEKLEKKKKAIDIMLETNNYITRFDHWAEPIIKCVKKAWSWDLDHKKYKLMRLKLHLEVIYNIPEESSIELCDKIQDKYDRVYFKASILRALKKYDEAIEEYKKLINIDYKPITCIYALVQCYIESGNLIDAEYYTKKGIDIMNNLLKDEEKFKKHKNNMLMTYGMLQQVMGYIYMRKYDIENSIFYLDQAEHYYLKSSNDFNLSGIYHAKAYSLLLACRTKESVLNYIKCIKLFKKRNYPHLTERRFEFIIDFYLEKNINRAKKIIHAFFDFLFRDRKNLSGKYYELNGKINYLQGNIKESENNFLHAVELYSKEKLYNQMINSKLRLHICRFLRGKDNSDFNELEEHFLKNQKYSQLALLYFVHKGKYEFQLNKTINTMNLIQKDIFEKECYHVNFLSKKKDQIKSRIIVTDIARKDLIDSSGEDIREHYEDFNIFLDYIKKEAFIKGKKINLFGKNIYEKILRELLISPELSLNVNDLYFKVWNDKDTDINRIRVNLTGLKKIFGDIFHYSRDIKVYSIKKGIDLCAIVK